MCQVKLSGGERIGMAIVAKVMPGRNIGNLGNKKKKKGNIPSSQYSPE